MSKDVNGLLTKRILESIPDKKKQIKYLMDSLNISRESVYRRIRGCIPFTSDEVFKLARKLNFSVDEIIETDISGGDYRSALQQKDMPFSQEHYFSNLLEHYRILELLEKAEKVDMMVSVNRLVPSFFTGFDKLFRFNYYTWMHQCGGLPPNYAFSKVELPSSIISIQYKIKSKISSVKGITFIFDRYVIMRLIRDIQCYNNRKLISEAELSELRSEIALLIEQFEKYLQTGLDGSSSACLFYLSLLDVNMNSIYGSYDGNIISLQMPHIDIPAKINKAEITEIHRNWIHSLKRNSILISQSNEIVQASFLNQQRENIDEITNDLLLYYG